MVYIRLNETILASMPKQLPTDIKYITIQKYKYLSYQDFKRISTLKNLNLHQYITKTDIISDIDFDRLLELSKRTPQQLRAMQQLKNKHEFRINNTNSKAKLNNQTYYYGNPRPQTSGNNIKQLTDSVSFGVTFIFSFFMAGVTGYFFALYFFHFQLTGCLVVSIIFIFATIFIETWLYIIKQTKANHKIQQQRKQWQKDQSIKAEYSIKSKLKYKTDTSSNRKMKKQ